MVLSFFVEFDKEFSICKISREDAGIADEDDNSPQRSNTDEKNQISFLTKNIFFQRIWLA